MKSRGKHRTRHEATLLLLLAVTGCLAGREPTATEVPLPSGLLVRPPWTGIQPGESVQLEASIVGPAGDTVSLGGVLWSERSHVATVDANGLATGTTVGVDTVVASFGQLGGYAIVVVAPPVLVGAGDIADCGLSSRFATANLLDTIPGIVFAAGDNAYEDGTTQQYDQCYGPSWGRHRARTRPTPGNHDYHTPGALPYFAYFGVNAGEIGKGYYSYSVGAWHVVAINSSIPRSPASPQVQWLRADLTAHPALCTIAYWHFPRFSSGIHGDDTTMTAVWQALHDAGADVVVSGHDHIYERFAPQTPDGQVDMAHGIREFVVGTGGGALTQLATIRSNSEVRIIGEFGVLRVTLNPGTYAWRFIPTRASAAADSGSANCH